MRLRGTKAPERPVAIDDHPEWIAFVARLNELEAAAGQVRREIGDKTDALQAARVNLHEAEVAVALGEDDAAAGRAATLRDGVAALEREIEQLRQALAPRVEAARRFKDRQAALRERLADEQRLAVVALHKALTLQLVAGLEALDPINRQLLELRRAFPAAAADLAFADYLRPMRGPAGLNPAGVFADRVRQSGVAFEVFE
jgi:hypothetical protein